ncbi:hypothetical protein GQX73_g4728 [Xylaria multiplex]|uniref:Uncharacterized protein n=1 Tax=Xylaria multiplex TaxID=323545 RepID=A0A7C8J1S8_9PEZI|nr:hypothetical protein GQX73_g4728 [Xylaria multiplex]
MSPAIPRILSLSHWEKLAAKAGFKDGTTAKAHYGALLQPDDAEGPSKRSKLDAPVAKDADVKTEDGARGQLTSYYLYDQLEEGEI